MKSPEFHIEPGVVTYVPIDLIEPDPGQPRRFFTESSIEKLAADIREHGLLQPVSILAPVDGGRYRLKLGERRYRACKAAGLPTIKAILVDDREGQHGDRQRFLDQLVENEHREALNPIDFAAALKSLRDSFGVKVGEIPGVLASRGLKEMSRSYVSNLIRLLDLPEWARQLIVAGRLTASHGKYLLPATASQRVMEILRERIEERLKDDEVYRTDQLQEDVYDAFVAVCPSPEVRWKDHAPAYSVDDAGADLGLVVISAPWGKKIRFITNLEAHEALQTKALADREANERAAEARRRKASDEAPASPEGEPSEAVYKGANPQRLREYLTGFMRELLVQELPAKGRKWESIAHALVLWWSTLCPRGVHLDGGDKGKWFRLTREFAGSTHRAIESIGYETLADFLEFGPSRLDPENAIARAAIAEMELPELRMLADFAGIDLAACNPITEEYLKLHTRQGLEQLVLDAGLDLSEFRAQKKVDLQRAWMAARPQDFPLPADLGELWESSKFNRDAGGTA